MGTMHDVLNAAQSRISRIGNSEMEILSAQIQAMAERMALGYSEVPFTDKRLSIIDAQHTYGHGTEPSVYVPGQYVITSRGKGAPVRYEAEMFGTVPEHAYPVQRITTPNFLINPPIASRLFMNDTMVRKQIAEQRNAFIENAAKTLEKGVVDLYGTLDVIPFDYLGSLTVVDKPIFYCWRNIVGDIIGYRWEVYVGYNILPARGMAAKPDEDVTALSADVTHIDNIGKEPGAN